MSQPQPKQEHYYDDSQVEPGIPNQKESPKRRQLSQKKKKHDFWLFIYIPFLSSLCGVWFISNFIQFYLAFFKWDGLGEMTFVGLNNFVIIFNDPLFWKSLYNTIVIGLMGTAPQLLAALLLAFALNSALVKGQSFFRLAIFFTLRNIDRCGSHCL